MTTPSRQCAKDTVPHHTELDMSEEMYEEIHQQTHLEDRVNMCGLP